MANYNATIRTNYFSVTDEAKFREIMASCAGSEDEIHLFEAENGSGKFGFGCYGCISGIPAGESETDDEPEPDLDAFYEALQSVLAEDDAIIITEIGNEKLRYLIGRCTVITKREIRSVSVSEKAVELAGEMLGNPDFTTQMEY